MSLKLPAVTSKEVVRVAQRLGFEFRRQTGSHAILRSSYRSSACRNTMHSGKTLKSKTLRAIIDDLGVAVDEFQAML